MKTRFQSTLSVWRATPSPKRKAHVCKISIPALRVESDMKKPKMLTKNAKNFNPRSPCGERLIFPVRRQRFHLYFNPRSPCGERLYHNKKFRVCILYFNPRSPCGERREIRQQLSDLAKISIHALRVESDYILFVLDFNPTIFQSTLSVWRATIKRFT